MRVSRVVGALLAFGLVVSACGSGTSEDAAGGPDVTGEVDGSEAADGEVVEEPVPGGPIEGAIVSVLSFEFGLFSLDPDTGEETELTVADAGFADRTEEAFVTDDGSEAYLIVYTTIEGQSFSNDVALARIDLASGDAEKLVEFGPNREHDESIDLTETRVIGTVGTNIWVHQKIFAQDEFSLIGFDRVTGAEAGRFTSARDDTIRNLLVLDDALYGQFNGLLSVLDGDGTGWTTVLDYNDLNLGTIIDPSEINEFGVTRSGSPISADWAEFILRATEARPSSTGYATGAGSLWWVFSGNTTFEEDSAIIGGVLQFDVNSGAVVDVWPLGAEAGMFLEENSLTAMSQVTYHFVDGALWMADMREDGKLYRVDPSEGITAFDIPAPAGIDYTEIELVTTDPTGLWLDVTEWVITSTEDGGRTSSGTSKFERYDTDSGTSVLEVDKLEISGF